MRRAALLALIAASLLTAQAQAQAPGPVIFTWDTYPAAPAVVVPECDGAPAREPAGGFDGGAFLSAGDCAMLDFAQPQALVEVFVRASRPSPLVVIGCAAQGCFEGGTVESSHSLAAGAWTPVILAAPGGIASIYGLRLSARTRIDIDDLGLSTSPAQPDTEIASAPPTDTPAHDASFVARANQPGATFLCTLDGTPGCSPYVGLATGPHTFTVAARDRWGLVDPSPAVYAWTVEDADRDGVADSHDNCPDVANPAQPDGDADTVGDACDLFAPGNVPPVAGKSVIAEDVRGEVFVKLPARSSLAALPDARTLLEDPGFLPLKGVASLPVGAVVDARKGSLTIASAANGRPAGDARRRLQRARLAAGIFRIRQARARRASSRRIPTTMLLASAAAAEQACARSTRRNPLRAIVRSLSLSGKGRFRAVGGASVGSARDATWVTTDRCDGTLTEVGRGKVVVRDPKRRKKRVTVRAGRGYFVKRPLFLPLKGRRPLR